jgi:hypothetical protein
MSINIALCVGSLPQLKLRSDTLQPDEGKCVTTSAMKTPISLEKIDGDIQLHFFNSGLFYGWNITKLRKGKRLYFKTRSAEDSDCWTIRKRDTSQSAAGNSNMLWSPPNELRPPSLCNRPSLTPSI